MALSSVHDFVGGSRMRKREIPGTFPSSHAYVLMSMENFQLQPLEQNGEEDEGNADPQEPPEDTTKLGTKSSGKVRYWTWKKISNTVMTLLGYSTLYTAIVMIPPYYPILVSWTDFLSPTLETIIIKHISAWFIIPEMQK